MKNLKLLSVFFMVMSAVTFTSCNDIEPIDPNIVIPTDPDPTDPDPTDPIPGVFKVDFDGGTYTATATQVYITGGSIQISALRPLGDGFGFLLSGTTVGTYEANQNIVAYTPANSDFGWWAVNPADDNMDTGTVTITAIDALNQTISGTFEFTGYWSDADNTTVPIKQFVNGSFTEIPFVTQSPTEDTFFANLDGEEYVENDLLVAVTTVGVQEMISIGTTDADGNAMTVSVKSTVGVGIYNLTGDVGADAAQIMFDPAGDELESTLADTGFVTIVEKTADRIKGSFGGTVTIGTVTFAITQGSFDVAY